jgi:hypothetical protein
VANTSPTVGIDRTGTTTFDGDPTVVGTQNVPVAFSGPITDPGSDDVAVTWAFGDGQSKTATNLVNPPATDPTVSPTVQPRSFTSSVTHPYAAPCVYATKLSAVDDDAGTAQPDRVDVVIVATAHGFQPNGFWKNSYAVRGQSTISAADLACYLKIVVQTSAVFGPGDPIALGSSSDASAILAKVTGTSAELFDRDVLVA